MPPHDGKPFVSVIIPVYNDAEGLKQCLAALREQTYPSERFEVVVVDNASEEPIAPVTEPFANVRLVREKKPGSYNARNRGIRCAKGEIFAFTDADCRPAADWLEQGIKHLQETENCGLVGGKIEQVAQDPANPNACEQFDQLFYLDQERAIRKGHYGATGNLFTTRAVMDDVGPFNADLWSSGDTEWGRRVYAHGYRQVYAGDARVKHPARGTLKQIYRRETRVIGGLYSIGKMEGAPKESWRRKLQYWLQPYRNAMGVLVGSTSRKISGIGKRVKVALLVLFVFYARQFEIMRLRLGGEPKNT